MEAIENATRLKARLLECTADPARPGWLRCTVQVKDSGPVDDRPSLVPAAVGDTLAVLVGPEDRAQLDAIKPGAGVVMQLRLRAPGVHTVVPGSAGVDY